MAMVNRPYGKDKVTKSSEAFISEALHGGHGPSEDIHDKKIGRGQTIKTALAMDNVELAMPIESSIAEEGGFGGSETNLKHSLTGTSAVQDDHPK